MIRSSLAYALQDTDNPASPQAGKIKLTDVLPDKTGMNLWHDMAVVQDNGKSATVEIVIPRKTDGGKTEDCLYRVTIYPFIEDMPDKKSKIGRQHGHFYGYYPVPPQQADQ